MGFIDKLLCKQNKKNKASNKNLFTTNALLSCSYSVYITHKIKITYSTKYLGYDIISCYTLLCIRHNSVSFVQIWKEYQIVI